MIDSAMFYLTGTFYPLVARATYPALGFGQYPGEVGASNLDAAAKAQAVKDATDALAEPLDVFHKFFLGDNKFIGGASPSIADIRLASTLEFLADDRLPVSGLGEGLHGRHGKEARQGLRRTRRRRAGIYRVCEVAEEVGAGSLSRHARAGGAVTRASSFLDPRAEPTAVRFRHV